MADTALTPVTTQKVRRGPHDESMPSIAERLDALTDAIETALDTTAPKVEKQAALERIRAKRPDRKERT